MQRNHAPLANSSASAEDVIDLDGYNASSPVNGSIISLTRMIDSNGNLLHRDRNLARNVESNDKVVRVGTCKCLANCIFAYEICNIDNPQCERICQQNAVNEFEANQKRGIATRSSLQLANILSQFVISREMTIGPLVAQFSTGLVLQTTVSCSIDTGGFIFK